MDNFGNSFRIILDVLGEIPKGMLVIFCLMIFGIALVVDTMLAHTFPAYTLIGLIIFVGVVSMKTYEQYLIKKNSKYFESTKFNRF